MATLNKEVIRTAFEMVTPDLPAASCEDCISSFSGEYIVVGWEEAFTNALKSSAPSVDPSSYKDTYKRFKRALLSAQAEHKERLKEDRERREEKRREAKTDAEKEQLRQEAETLRREVSDKKLNFRRVYGDVRDVNRETSKEVVDLRKLARESGFGTAESVANALESAEDIAGKNGETERLMEESGDILKEVQEAVRNDDVESIVSSIDAVEAILSRLEDIRDVDLPEAQSLVELAIDNSRNEKDKADKAAAINTAVTDADADLDAMQGDEGIVSKTAKAVEAHKLAIIEKHGEVSNGDAVSFDDLVTKAENALKEAQRLHETIEAQVVAEDKNAVENTTSEISAQRKLAQEALDEIDRLARAFRSSQSLESAKVGYVESTKEKHAKESDEKVGRLLQGWQAHAVVLGLFLAASYWAWEIFTPWAKLAVVVVGISVFVIYVISTLKAQPQKGLIALASYTLVKVGIIFFILLAPSSGVDILEKSDPTPTATAEPAAEPEFTPVATLAPELTPTPAPGS